MVDRVAKFDEAIARLDAEVDAHELPPLKFGPTGELCNLLAAKLRELTGPLLDTESFDLAEEFLSLCGIDPGKECESGLELCGPATMSDSEGVPLCTRCFIGLALEQRNLRGKVEALVEELRHPVLWAGSPDEWGDVVDAGPFLERLGGIFGERAEDKAPSVQDLSSQLETDQRRRIEKAFEHELASERRERASARHEDSTGRVEGVDR